MKNMEISCEISNMQMENKDYLLFSAAFQCYKQRSKIFMPS
jgi:hypothetical protein